MVNVPKAARVEELLQTGPCTSTSWRPRGTRLPSICLPCRSRSKNSKEPCRFQDFRILTQPSARALQVASFGIATPSKVEFVYRSVFNMDPGPKELTMMQYAISTALRPVLQREIAACMKEGIVYKDAESDYMVRCDYCGRSVLFVTYFCECCAMELCLDCFDSSKFKDPDFIEDHSCMHRMRPCSRTTLDILSGRLRDVEDVLKQPRPSREPSGQKYTSDCLEAVAEYATVPRIRTGQEEVFRDLAEHGIPVLIELGANMKGEWDPVTLSRLYGDEKVTVIVVNKEGVSEELGVPLSTFLDRFQHAELRVGESEKLKDWPDSSCFFESCRAENDAFNAMSPFPSFTTEDGRYNIAAYFARNLTNRKSHMPDLGPKMYLATSDILHVGSTALHLDETSAVNLLVHDQKDTTEPRSGALWTIFRRDDLDIVRAVIRDRYNHTAGDPVLNQQYYLNDADIQALVKAGARPFRFVQQRGEAVFINAGCAHQVSNISSCIKIATDFLDAQSLPTTVALDHDFWMHRQDDSLLLKLTLWHAWISVTQKLTLGPHVAAPRSRQQKKHHLHRKSTAARNDQARRHEMAKTGVDPKTGNRKHIEGGADEQKMSPEEYARIFDTACPHTDCRDRTRRYSLSQIRQHIKDAHGIFLEDSQASKLFAAPKEQMRALFRSIHDELQYGLT